jgi:hypothetical protein
MKKRFLINVIAFLIVILPFVLPAAAHAISPTPTPCLARSTDGTVTNCIIVDQNKLGFKIPTLSTILTFAIRMIFVVGGIVALIFLLLGAFSWITSGGEKDAIGKAQAKIQAAILGVILIAVVLALAVTLEQVVFRGAICFGLSCPITIPPLLQPVGTPPTTIPASQTTTGQGGGAIQEIVTETPVPNPSDVEVIILDNTPTPTPLQPDNVTPHLYVTLTPTPYIPSK